MSRREEILQPQELERLREQLAHTEAQLRALQESEARCRVLVDATLVGVYVLSEDGTIVQANPQAGEIFGYTVAEVVGMNVLGLVDPEDHVIVRENIRQRINAEVEAMRYEVRGLHRSGARLALEVHGGRTTFEGRPAVVGTVIDRTGSRRAEAALQASEARFQAFMDNTSAIAYMRDTSGRYLYANLAYRKFVGVEDIVGKSAEEVLGPEYGHALLRGDRAVLDRGRAIESAMDWTAPDGVKHHFVISKFPIHESSGSILVGGVAFDITERVRAEQALAEQTRILQSILDSMGDGVAVANEKGHFLIFNPAARRITGLGPQGETPEDWVSTYGIFLPDRVTPYPPDQVPLVRAIHGESTDNVELYLRNPSRPEGSWMTVTGRPLLDDGGQIRGGVVVFHDTTERRLTLDQLERAEAKYRALVEQLPVVSYIRGLDPLGAVYYVSPQVESLLGFKPDAWVNTSNLWIDQIHPEDRKRAIEEMKRSIADRDRCVNEYRMFGKDGSVVHVHDESVHILDAEGRPVAAQGVVLDITDREVERLGRQRLQALSIDLVAVQEAERRRIGLELHDEIGQTLTALKLRLAANHGLPREALERRLQEVDQLVDEAMEHVRELSQNLRPTVLDDLGLLPALLSYFSRYTRQNGIRVQFEHHGIERRRFTQEVETAAYRIVQEALTNAARHAGVQVVKVRAWADAKCVGVRVEDAGTGFDAGAALATGRTRGLAGMRERAALLHGQLTVVSSPGKGACVTGELPVVDAVAE